MAGLRSKGQWAEKGPSPAGPASSKQQAAGQAACSKSVDPRISVSAYWAGGSLSVPINPDFSYRGASDEPVTYTPRSLRNQCGL